MVKLDLPPRVALLLLLAFLAFCLVSLVHPGPFVDHDGSSWRLPDTARGVRVVSAIGVFGFGSSLVTGIRNGRVRSALTGRDPSER